MKLMDLTTALVIAAGFLGFAGIELPVAFWLAILGLQLFSIARRRKGRS